MVKDEVKDFENNLEIEGEPVDPEVEELESFDLRALITEGKDAVHVRKVEFFDVNKNKIVKAPIRTRAISHADWEHAAKQTSKKNGSKNIEELICAKGWLDENDEPYLLSVIREAPNGLVSAVYEELKKVSGQIKDTLQDAYLEKISDF